MRKIIMAVLVAAGLVAGLAATASASPPAHRANIGWLFAGHIKFNGTNQCLTAHEAKVGAIVESFGCVKGDLLQEWDAIAVQFKVGPGVVQIDLAGQKGTKAHPELCIGGVAAPDEELRLIDCTHDVPLPESTFITGNLSREFGLNRISNQIRRYVGLPGRSIRARSPKWTGRFLPRDYNRSLVFGIPAYGERGWIEEQAV